jgi:hypothetical protein
MSAEWVGERRFMEDVVSTLAEWVGESGLEKTWFAEWNSGSFLRALFSFAGFVKLQFIKLNNLMKPGQETNWFTQLAPLTLLYTEGVTRRLNVFHLAANPL